MNKMVSIIIINWNGKGYLKTCLPLVYKQDYKNIEVILVDNASMDGSVGYVRKNHPEAKIIINKENLGFAEANNIGYRIAKGDYILFLNNDTEVTYNFLSELVKMLESDKQIGGVQSKILLMDDPERLDSVGAFLTHTGFLYHYGIAKKDSPTYNKQIEIYSAKGACMLYKKSVLEEIKINDEVFDSSYFAYFEETDMCHRVWLAGYKIIFVPSSVIYHKMGGTSTKLSDPFVQFHSFKNRINSYLKNLSFSTLIWLLPSHIVFCELYAFISLVRLNYWLFLAIQKSIWWNIATLKRTFTLREIIQTKIRKVSDKELLLTSMKKVRPSYYRYLLTGLDRYVDGRL